MRVAAHKMRRPDKHLGTVILGYVLEQLIGWGTSSKVYRARHHLTGHVQAVKVISKRKSRIGHLHQSVPECSAMSKLKHPNIVELNEWFESEKKVYIIMEIARDGDLLAMVQQALRPPSEDQVQRWFVQIVDALAFAHSRGWAHQDIKLENILLDGNRVLLGDWGSAMSCTAGIPSASFESVLGYDAPEVLARRSHFPHQIDCWSLGVTLYALACGKLPFERVSPKYIENVMSSNYPMPVHLSARLRSLIRGLLSVDPVIRFTIFDIQHHEFFTSAKLPLMFPPMPDVASQRESILPVCPSHSGGSGFGSDLCRRRATVATTTTKVRLMHESPPRSSSFASLQHITRDPPSPIHSAVSSLQNSPSSSTDSVEAARRPNRNSIAIIARPNHTDTTPMNDSSSSSPGEAERSPERNKAKKPLARAFKFIKHLPARMLGSTPANPA